MKTTMQTLRADTFDRCLDMAAHCLQKGDICALPTETVYGLCADAKSQTACQRLYDVKGRAPSKPISLLASSIEMAADIAEVHEDARRLFHAFSPGPLTLVLPKRSDAAIADVLTSGGDDIGIRIPDHPFILALLKRLGRPIAATSANLSGACSPIEAAPILAQLEGRIPLLIDGGTTSVRLASTVIGWTQDELRIYRAGSISHQDAIKVLNLN